MPVGTPREWWKVWRFFSAVPPCKVPECTQPKPHKAPWSHHRPCSPEGGQGLVDPKFFWAPWAFFPRRGNASRRSMFLRMSRKPRRNLKGGSKMILVTIRDRICRNRFLWNLGKVRIPTFLTSRSRGPGWLLSWNSRKHLAAKMTITILSWQFHRRITALYNL